MDVKGVLQRVLQKEGVEVMEVREGHGGTSPGDHYMSEVTTLEVVGRRTTGETYQAGVFVKRPAGGAARQQLYRVDRAFHNEVLVYRSLAPLCGARGVLPRCIHADPSLILLEDLRLEGFAMPDRRLGLDRHTTAAVLKVLARFHAASYHTSITKPEEFAYATSQLKPIGLVLSSSSEVVKSSVRRAVRQLSDVEDLQEAVTVLRALQGKVQQALRTLRRPVNLGVLIHGDLWANNLMVRPGDAAVRLVDLQACALQSPAVDVWTLLYTSLQQNFLDDQFDQLLQLYCESFKDELTSLNTHKTPSISQILQEINSKEMYGFLVALVYFPALDLTGESVPDLDNTSKEQMLEEDFLKQFETPLLKMRVCNLTRHCLKRGLFHRLQSCQ